MNCEHCDKLKLGRVLSKVSHTGATAVLPDDKFACTNYQVGNEATATAAVAAENLVRIWSKC